MVWLPAGRCGEAPAMRALCWIDSRAADLMQTPQPLWQITGWPQWRQGIHAAAWLTACHLSLRAARSCLMPPRQNRRPL